MKSNDRPEIVDGGLGVGGGGIGHPWPPYGVLKEANVLKVAPVVSGSQLDSFNPYVCTLKLNDQW